MAETEVDLSGELDGFQPESPSSKKGWTMSLAMNTNVREWVQKRRESVHPWADFFNFSKFKAPKAIAPVGKRVVKNVERFQSNYLFIFAGLVIFCVLTSPMLLIAIAACLGACYIISLKNAEKKLALMGKEVSVTHQYAAVGVLSFPLFWAAGAGSAVFWVIGASFFVIMLHASLFSLEDELEQATIEDLETV